MISKTTSQEKLVPIKTDWWKVTKCIYSFLCFKLDKHVTRLFKVRFNS